MHHLACAVMILTQSRETGPPRPAPAQPKVKKAPVLQTFAGPGGEYQLPVPYNFNEAMASPQAAHWWAAMA